MKFITGVSRREPKRLTRRCGSGERKNSSTDDRADADASQRECTERAFQLPVRRGGLSHQMVWAFLAKKSNAISWNRVTSARRWSIVKFDAATRGFAKAIALARH